jgi:nucleoside-specific outer membrane channel protein Tsx
MHLHRVKSSAVRLLAALSLAALLAPVAARAEFGTTNFQLLQGFNFNDNLLGYNTAGGGMTTVTVNHFSTWKYGDNFAFVDFYRGKFLNAFDLKTGNRSLSYAEWHPRLFLNKLGAPTGGFVKNWGLAGEINASNGFYALLAGVGLDLAIPGFQVAGLNIYYRDAFVQAAPAQYTNTWQISPFWDIPFKVGPTSWDFSGFVDITTDHDKKIDIMAQPELLLDVGAFMGAPGKFHVGTEIYIHRYENLSVPSAFTPAGGTLLSGGTKTVIAPQIMIQWTPYTQFVP